MRRRTVLLRGRLVAVAVTRSLILTAPLRSMRRLLCSRVVNAITGALIGVHHVDVHSTRLLARDVRIPSRVRLRFGVTGIARACTTIAYSDPVATYTSGVRRRAELQGSVFIDTDNGVARILEIGSSSTGPVIVGGSDRTYPQQLDVRYAPSSPDEVRAATGGTRGQRLFVENLDVATPDLLGLPTGIVPTSRLGTVRSASVAHRERQGLRVLSASRIRQGAQWDDRREVQRLADEEWADLCTSVGGEVTAREYRRLLQEHTFVLCPHGGGFDPSPKAWEALLEGCIPIVRTWAGADGYAGLPVLWVSDWVASEVTVARLRATKERLDPVLRDRGRLLDRLSHEHWVRRIREQSRPAAAPASAARQG